MGAGTGAADCGWGTVLGLTNNLSHGEWGAGGHCHLHGPLLLQSYS